MMDHWVFLKWLHAWLHAEHAEIDGKSNHGPWDFVPDFQRNLLCHEASAEPTFWVFQQALLRRKQKWAAEKNAKFRSCKCNDSSLSEIFRMPSTYSFIKSLWSSKKSRTLWLQRAQLLPRQLLRQSWLLPSLSSLRCQCLSGRDSARIGRPQLKRWSLCPAPKSTLLPDRCHGTLWCCLLVEPTPRGACPEQDNTLAGGSRWQVAALETQKLLHWKRTNVAMLHGFGLLIVIFLCHLSISLIPLQGV